MYNDFMRFSPPEQYMLCTNSACKKAGNCLRHLVFAGLSENDEKIYTLNPKFFPKEDEKCRHFRPDEKIRIAWGTRKIFDDVPLKKAEIIKARLLQHFGKTLYYRFYRSERPVTTESQIYIEETFRANGISAEIKYESYTEDYDWRY